MSNAPTLLIIVSLSSCLLAGCGGSSSSGGGGGSQPQPGVKHVTVDNQSSDNVMLTNGVLNKSVGHHQQLKTSYKSPVQDLSPEANMVIEYYRDQPQQPANTNGLTFSPLSPVSCSKPLSRDDKCVSTKLTFNPQSTGANITKQYFDGKLTVHAFVPFRMFPESNTLITGTPNTPNFHLTMTTTNPATSMSFNIKNMPTQAVFSSPGVVDRDSQQPINIPFSLSADASAGDVDVNYICTPDPEDNLCNSDFAKATLLKAFKDNTQLSYQGTIDKTTNTLPMQLILSRAFIITTDQGEAYALNNPTKPTPLSPIHLMLQGGGTEPTTSLSSYTKGEAIDNITLPARTSSSIDFLNPLSSISIKDTKDVISDGALTGLNYDYEMSQLPNTLPIPQSLEEYNNGAADSLARSRFTLYPDGNYVASLMDRSESDKYQVVITKNGIAGTHDDPKKVTLNGIDSSATLNNMIITAAPWGDQNSRILFSGSLNKQTVFYQATTDGVTIGQLTPVTSSFQPIDPDSKPIHFNYNTYTNNTVPPFKGEMNPPEQKFVYLHSNNQLVLVGPSGDSSTAPVVTTITLNNQEIKGVPIAFSCSDTDVTPNTTKQNRCYLMTQDNSATEPPYCHIYQFDNLDADAGTTVTTTYQEIHLNLQQNQPRKAIIEGNTGALLTLEGVDDKSITLLYTLNGLQYQNPKTVSLPKSPSGDAQEASNIFKY